MKNISKIISSLKKLYSVDFFERTRDPFEVLIFTIISQRNRDESTIKVTRKLFEKYNTPEKLVKAPLSAIEGRIKQSGFYRAKAKNIQESSRKILSEHGGKVPATMDELLELPGVGRKTANCVLVYGFNIPAIPVDTHVHRISNRLGWVKTKTPEETEEKLIKILPKKYWLPINELLVQHGQGVCGPIKTECEKCPVLKFCPTGKKKI